MVLASYHVIKEILKNWPNVDLTMKEFEKLSKRYPKDIEFQKIFEDYKACLNLRGDLDIVKSKLKELENIRRIDVSGGTRLPYEDRRRF